MKEPIILASTSPRRKQLLAKICPQFEIVAPILEEEILDTALPLAAALEKLALEKARSVSRRYPDCYVIGADTIVSLQGKILGKPCNAQAAKEMLMSLSGATHDVLTAVAVVHEASNFISTVHEVTQVTFRELGEKEIDEYIATGEPFDKAGAYGIQENGRNLVASVNGGFDNVVGLPVALVQKLLEQ